MILKLTSAVSSNGKRNIENILINVIHTNMYAHVLSSHRSRSLLLMFFRSLSFLLSIRFLFVSSFASKIDTTLIGYEGKTTKLRRKRLLLRRHIVATAEQCTKIFHRTSKNSGARVSVGVKSVSSLFLLPREREYNFLLLISFALFDSIYNSIYIT